MQSQSSKPTSRSSTSATDNRRADGVVTNVEEISQQQGSRIQFCCSMTFYIVMVRTIHSTPKKNIGVIHHVFHSGTFDGGMVVVARH
jgi:hypothetical protein